VEEGGDIDAGSLMRVASPAEICVKTHVATSEALALASSPSPLSTSCGNGKGVPRSILRGKKIARLF